MKVPNESHPGWVKAISGKESYAYEFLATKILMGRLNLLYQRNPSPETIKSCVTELRSFFEKNQHIPKAQADLIKIFGDTVTK